MSNLVFNSPPSWPAPPEGWVPPKGWVPDPSWPAAPEGWVFWVEKQPVHANAHHNSPYGPAVPEKATSSSGGYQLQPEQGKRKSKWYTIGTLSAGIFILLLAGYVAALPYLPKSPESSSNSNDDYSFSSDIFGDDSLFPAAGKYVKDTYPPVEEVTIGQAKEFLQKEYKKTMTELNSYEHGVDFYDNKSNIEETYNKAMAETSTQEVYYSLKSLANTRDFMKKDYEYWESLYAVKEENLVNASGTIAEGELIKVSKGVAGLIIDPDGRPCNGILIVEPESACVRVGSHMEDAAKVQIPSYQLDKDWTEEQWNNILTHEFAHVIQNKYESKLLLSKDFQNLFGNDREHHADCMATAIKSNYVSVFGGTCSPSQLASAAKIWEGDVGELNPKRY